MSIRIIADSGSDLSGKESEYLKIIPLKITFGDTQYQDGVTLSHEEFYSKLIESDELPKTSQVPPFDFEEAIQEALDAGDIPIVITVASKLSGTYNSARIAASEFGEKVYVIDSENVAMGEKILVQYAIRMVEEGLDAEAIVAKLEKEKKKICLVALLDTLEYLQKGGRVSNVVGFVGGVLSIKPVVTIKDGEIVMLGKARGTKNGNKMLTQQIEAIGGIDFTKPYALGYSGLEDDLLQKYIADNEEVWVKQDEELPIGTIGGTIGTHAGPGAFGYAFFAL